MEHEHATSLTARAVKRALPDRAILTKDARQTLNSATSVFTLYLASLCAHETSVANKRNTITLKDVLQTLRDADFEHFIEPIEACLQEAKVTDCKINAQIIVAEDEEGGETTNEVAHQLEDVAIDTNEEDDDDMVSMDEPISAAAGKV
ncbi:putative histone-fold protein [Plasmopara halstedii]